MKALSPKTEDRQVFVYIHEWVHKIPDDVETFKNHPIPGRIYPASVGKDGGVKILLPEDASGGYAGIAISSMRDENFRWLYSLEEVTPKNLPSLPLVKEDMKMFLKHELESTHPMDIFMDKMSKQSESSQEEPLEEFTPFSPTRLQSVIDDYIPEDDIMADTLSEMIEFMSGNYEDGKMADTVARTLMILDSDVDRASSVLLFNAIMHIAEYSKSITSGSEDKIALFNAISYLLIEITQRKTNKNGNTDIQND